MKKLKNLSNKMFDDIGNKMKLLAKIVCWIGIIISALFCAITILTGLLSFISSFSAMKYVFSGSGSRVFVYILRSFGVFILTIIVGAIGLGVGGLISWLGSLKLYGYGELIDRTAQIARNTGSQEDEKKDQTPPAAPTADIEL